MQAGDLRCRIDVYEPGYSKNEMGEDIQDGLELVKSGLPAQIVPSYGVNRDMPGGADTTEITHKIRIRKGSLEVRPEYVIMFEDQRYDVKYWQPVYNNTRYMEILAVMEVAT